MARVRESLDTWDVLPSDMVRYLKNYGRHFNRKAYEFAVSKMYKVNRVNGQKEYIQPMTTEQFNTILSKYNIKLENDVMCDGMYVMSMAMADYFGSSLPNERMIALFVKDYVDDVDQKDGFIFNRFYADCVLSGTPIDWEDLV